MKSIRIGNDIRIEWPIVLSGDVSKLQDLDLTVEVRPSAKIIDTHNYADEIRNNDNKRLLFEKHETTVMMNGGLECRRDIGDGKEHCRPRPPRPCPPRPIPPAPVKLPYHIEDNTLIAMWTADRQFATGDYDIILYAHKNEGGQAVCDQYRFVRLVSHTAQADAPDDSGIEAVIAMQPVTLELSGLSAYEVAVINGFQGTEEEWLASLKKPAEDAAEQAKKDLEQFKTETKAEVKQDITNLNANTGVDEYPVFSDSEAYSAGDVVNYNGKLYKFTADHAVGAWTGTDAEETDAVKAHIVQELGNSENAVVSQNAVTDNFNTSTMIDVLDAIPTKVFTFNLTPNSISINLGNKPMFFNAEVEITTSIELDGTEKLSFYVQFVLNGTPSYYNPLHKDFTISGNKLLIKVNASEFNRNKEYDDLVTQVRIVLQYMNSERACTFTIDKFDISGDAAYFLKESKNNSDYSNFKNAAEETFDNIKTYIGPFITTGSANNTNPPTMNLSNANGRCLNGYSVKAGEKWVYSGRAYWHGIWIEKSDGTVDESLWDGTDLTYTNRKITIPVDGKLYAWGIVSSSLEIPVFSISKEEEEETIISQISALQDKTHQLSKYDSELQSNIRNIQYQQGYFNGNHVFTDKAGFKCIKEYPVKEGEVYCYSGRFYYSGIFLIKDEDDSIVDIIPSTLNSTFEDFRFTIPADGKLCAWSVVGNVNENHYDLTLFCVENKMDSVAYQGKYISEKASEIATITEDMFVKTDLSQYIPNDATIDSSDVNYRHYLRVPVYLLDEGDVLFVRFKVNKFIFSSLYLGSSTNYATIQFNKDEDGFKHSVQIRIPITKEILDLRTIVSGVEVLNVFTQFTPTEEVTFGFDKSGTFINKKVEHEKVFVDAYEHVTTPTASTNPEQEYAQRLNAVITKDYFNEIVSRVGKFVVKTQFRSRDNSDNTCGFYIQTTSKFVLSFVSDGQGGYITPEYYYEIKEEDFGDSDSLPIIVQIATPAETDRYTWEVLEVLDNRIDVIKNEIEDLKNNDATKKIASITNTLEIPFRGYSTMTPITVKKDGSGDFTTIQDAINNITDASVIKQYDIQVYDDFEITDLKDLYISTGEKNTSDNPTREVALIWTKNWVHIRSMKGRGNKLYIESPLDIASTTFQYVQVIKAQSNCIINNFYVGIKGGRYAIHQESGGSKTHIDYHAHTIYKDLIIEHKGNDSYTNGSGWTATMAQANGTTSGLKQTYINCKWISANKTPFYTHTNSEFDEPNEQTMINCSIVCTSKNIKISDMGQYWGDIGSGQKAILKFIGCNIANFKNAAGYGGPRGTETTNNVRVKYGYNGGAELQGYGNTPMAVVQISKPCLTFNTVDNNKQIDVVGGTAYDLLWEKTWEKIKGTPANQGFCIGSIRLAYALTWSSNSQVFCLPYILGNCASSPKTLIVKVGEQEYTITFNKNYMTADGGSYSWNTEPAVNNSQVIADINAVQPTIFRASFNSPIQELYTFEDCQELGINASTSVISAGKCLKRSLTGHQMWEIAQDGDMVDGVAGNWMIPIDYADGDNVFGRILLPKKSYFPVGIFGLSGVTAGTMYKAANEGKLVTTEDKSEASFIAVDSSYLIGI